MGIFTSDKPDRRNRCQHPIQKCNAGLLTPRSSLRPPCCWAHARNQHPPCGPRPHKPKALFTQWHSSKIQTLTCCVMVSKATPKAKAPGLKAMSAIWRANQLQAHRLKYGNATTKATTTTPAMAARQTSAFKALAAWLQALMAATAFAPCGRWLKPGAPHTFMSRSSSASETC